MQSSPPPPGRRRSASPLAQQISELGEWFHNIDLHGIQTAPNHFLGDFPNVKWKHIAPAIPQDLSGATVLDIGCNGGFYSHADEAARRQRGCSASTSDDRYLNQARFAARTLGLEIELRKVLRLRGRPDSPDSSIT